MRKVRLILAASVLAVIGLAAPVAAHADDDLVVVTKPASSGTTYSTNSWGYRP